MDGIHPYTFCDKMNTKAKEMNRIETSIPECVQTIRSNCSEDGKIQSEAICLFPDSFPGFAGHFPGSPILPAIVQLATVRHIAEKTIEKRLLPTSFSRTKFRGMVKPNEKIFINLDVKAENGMYVGKFSILSDSSKPIASGSFKFNQDIS